MSPRKLFLSVVTSMAMLMGSFSALNAQEASPEHIAAAKKALTATKATEGFDLILPRASVTLKNVLSANNPDRADEIDRTVDEEALALASRRGDLENEAAKLFAVSFTQAELETITAFFGTETGQKYLSSTPVLGRELSKAARVWGAGVQRDLELNVSKKLQEAAAKN